MTKKHFEMMAKAIREELAVYTPADDAINAARVDALACLVSKLCKAFYVENPRFDTTRFTKACGF